MEYDAEKVQLSFNPNKQLALLGHLLDNERFFLQARTSIRPEWFLDAYSSRLFKGKLDFYAQFKRTPSREELFDMRDFRAEDPAWQRKLRGHAGLATVQSTQFQLDKLSLELTTWLRSNKLQEAMYLAEACFNKEDPEKSCKIMKEFGRTIEEVRFDTRGAQADFSDVGFLGEIQKERGAGLTFGLDIVDRMMNPHGGGGGLFVGDTTLLLAPPNVGKTTCMITIASANLVRLDKNILFITHEGAEKDIMLKFWQRVTRRTQAEVFALYNSGKWHDDATVRFMMEKLTKNICYLPMNKAGQNVDEVESQIRKKQDEWLSRTGRGFDMLVDDYPAKLSTGEQKGGSWARRQIDDLIYNRFVDLAGELRFHCLLAIQANREASKINAGVGKENRLLSMEDASESFGPMASATNVISLNRKTTEKLMKYKLCKSRSSTVGQTIICESMFEKATTHANDLLHRSYPGDLHELEAADFLLKNGPKGSEIQWDEVSNGYAKKST